MSIMLTHIYSYIYLTMFVAYYRQSFWHYMWHLYILASGIYEHILSGILATVDGLSGMNADIVSFYLASILTFWYSF